MNGSAETGKAQALRRAATSIPVRAGVTLALLGLLATRIDWSQFADRLRHGDWGLFAAAVVVVAVALAIAALRWRVFLQAAGVQADVVATLRAYWIGMFANNFLPTGFGGDVARGWIVGRPLGSVTRALASVVVDRLSALGCLVALGWLPFVMRPSEVPNSLIVLFAIVTAAGGIVVGVLAAGAHYVGESGSRAPMRTARWLRGEALDAVRASVRSRSVMVRTTMLGLLYQAGIVFATWLLARAIDIDLSFAVLAVVTPLVLIATLVPISIGGFGLREASYAALLSKVGVSTADATLLSLLNVAALAIATLPGALALLLPAPGLHEGQVVSLRSEDG
jgi:glycosyltransferase 2 family protein